jgi:repressor of nif and glnA expression
VLISRQISNTIYEELEGISNHFEISTVSEVVEKGEIIDSLLNLQIPNDKRLFGFAIKYVGTP